MPSLLSRLAALFPGYRPRAALPPPAIPPLDVRLDNLVSKVKDKLDSTPRLRPPSGEEKVPLNYHGGVAGKVWFLPYQDSVTKDTPEIRAAMRLMWRDGYVVTAWEPQIRTVASEDWQVQPSEAGNPGAEEQADFCKAVVEDYVAGGMPDCVRAVVAGFGPDGFTLAEPVWAAAEKGRLEKKIVLAALKAKDVDQNSVRLEGDRFGNVRWVRSMRDPHQDAFPIEDFVYTRYVTCYDEPLGMAAFRPAYSAYWMRDTVKKLRAIHHEKRMAGFLVGTYQNDDDKPGLEDTLRRAKSSTWATVPEGVRLEAVALSTASEPDYRSFDESLRDEIVSAIAFATLQSIQGNVPDARGDSKVQKAMADLGPWFLMARVQEAFNKQIFPRLIDYNFPFPAAGGYPKLTFGAVSNSELMELAQLVQAAQGLGLKPSRKHYAKALSIQEADPNDPDDQLGGQQPGGGMGLPSGGFGGQPGGDQFGGGDPFGGGQPAIPPGAPPAGGGGFTQQFSEGVHYEFREPVKWERQGNGTWKSSGGRVLSDAAYQRHLARQQRQARGRDLAKNPVLGPPQTPPPAAAATPKGKVAVPPPGPRPDPAGVDPVLAGKAVVAAVGGGVRKAKAAGRRVRKMVAKAAGGGLTGLRVALGKGMAGGLAWLGKQGEKLGSWLADWDWLERNTGVGTAIANKGRRTRARFQAVKAAFETSGLGRGSRKLVREAVRMLGTRWSESRKKYGAVLAIVIETVMTAWGFGRKAAFAAFDLATGFSLSAVTSKASALLTGHVRRAVEYPAKLIAGAWTGKPFTGAGRTVGAGRVAQAIEWAAGLRPRAEAKLRAGGKTVGTRVREWALGVPGSRPRGGEVTPQKALEWADAAREIQRADLEGRDARGIDPATEKLVRRALAISAEGNAGKYEAKDAREGRNAARRFRSLRRRAKLRAARKKYLGFSEADPNALVLDLRDGIDEARAMQGLPPTDATDAQLAGALVVVLEEFARKIGPAAAEVFAEVERFAERREGEEWETNGRRYKRQGGKTRRVKGPDAPADFRVAGGLPDSPPPPPAPAAAGGDFRVVGGLPSLAVRGGSAGTDAAVRRAVAAAFPGGTGDRPVGAEPVRVTTGPREVRGPGVRLSFGTERELSAPTPRAVRPGTMDLFRGLERLAGGLAERGLVVSYHPTDKRRSRLYARAMSRAGYVPVVTDELGTGNEFWVPAARVPADRHAALFEAHRAAVAATPAIPERFGEVESFAWTAGQTKRNTVKAIGTGEDEGKTLYGKKAEAALRRSQDAGPRVAVGNLAAVVPGRQTPTRPGKELTDVRQVRKARTRAEGPTPEARAAYAADEPMRKLAEKVKSGDPAAARQFQQEAVQRAEQAVAALPSPPEPAAVDRVVKAGLGRAAAGKVGGAVANFFKGLTGLGGESRGVSGWLGRRAQDLVTGLARMGRWALGAGVRLLGSVARAAGRFARSDTGKVVGLWAGSIAVAAAAVAAPVVAVNLGLIHWTSGLLLAPVAAAVGRMTYRVASRRAARVAPILGADRNPVREFAEPKDLALAGPDGRRAEELTAEARKDLTRLFAEGARAAVHRMMASGNPLGATVLFTDDELAGIAAGLSRTIATADLLGRARIRRRAKMAEAAAIGQRFAEGGDDPYHDFAEPVPVLVPQKAIEYVRGKVPEIDPGPDRYGSRLDRHATTMAIAADQTLLEKVKAAIVKELEGGGDATPDIDAILTNAGLNPDDPQYAEMIARTNVNDALNSGAADELQTPEMREAFPAWRYEGVLDSRTGDDHRPMIGKYYPVAANFADVRGQRIWNCVLPGQYVHARARKALKANYAGEVVEVHCASGNRFTITANHPVLTSTGFVRAGDLVEGQNLLNYLREDEVTVLREHDENPPSLIEDVFESLSVLVGGPRPAPVADLDLHGDARFCDGKIDVVGADVELVEHVETSGLKWHCKQSLAGSDLPLLQEPSGRPAGLDVGGVLHAPAGGVGSGNLSPPTVGGVGLYTLRVGSASHLDARREKSCGDGGTADAELASELVGRCPGNVSPDKIVYINRFTYAGHVYDLETDVGYYFVGSSPNNVNIVSNCRCGFSPVPKSQMADVRLEESW